MLPPDFKERILKAKFDVKVKSWEEIFTENLTICKQDPWYIVGENYYMYWLKEHSINEFIENREDNIYKYYLESLKDKYIGKNLDKYMVIDMLEIRNHTIYKASIF